MNNPGVTVFLISLKAGGVALVSYTISTLWIWADDRIWLKRLWCSWWIHGGIRLLNIKPWIGFIDWVRRGLSRWSSWLWRILSRIRLVTLPHLDSFRCVLFSFHHLHTHKSSCYIRIIFYNVSFPLRKWTLMARLSSFNTKNWQWRKLRFRLTQMRHSENWLLRMWVPCHESYEFDWRCSWVSSSRCSIRHDTFCRYEMIPWYATRKLRPHSYHNVKTPLDTLSVLNRLLFSTSYTLHPLTLPLYHSHSASLWKARAFQLRHHLRYSLLLHRSFRIPGLVINKELIVWNAHTPLRGSSASELA